MFGPIFFSCKFRRTIHYQEQQFLAGELFEQTRVVLDKVVVAEHNEALLLKVKKIHCYIGLYRTGIYIFYFSCSPMFFTPAYGIPIFPAIIFVTLYFNESNGCPA